MADTFSQYSRTVDYYSRYRPRYPQALIEWLNAECALSSSQVIADIGSGTGQMTELFLQRERQIVGCGRESASERLYQGQ